LVLVLRLVPDKVFDTVNEITPELLKAEGIKGLVLDIDYTLAPRHEPLPDEALKNWIRAISGVGIKLFIISNNRRERVSKFAQALGLPFIWRGLKPLPRSFLLAVKSMGLEPSQVAAVGDQIYTDVVGAHMAGIQAWLVSPFLERQSFFYKLRRLFERPAINRFYKNNGGN
jgi:HAD superfamily phosphatase (TIGR01668 family)